VRAVQTWELAATQVPGTPPAGLDERLYGASATDLLAATHELAEEATTAVFVGHNPGLEDFLTLLTGAIEPLKTSAVAVISAPGSWAATGPDSATLIALETPRG
jgi:phosphohistidine phosphatase